MTKSVNEGEDAGAATGQGSFFSVSLFAWILWPAVFVLFFRDAGHDFVRVALSEYFFYPPSLDNISRYWINDRPVYWSLYLSAWCVNSLLIALRYVAYLFENPWHVTESERQEPVGKLVVLGLFGLLLAVVMCSSIAFDVETPLSAKEDLLLNTLIGFWVALPGMCVGVAGAPIASVYFFFVAWRKIFARLRKA